MRNAMMCSCRLLALRSESSCSFSSLLARSLIGGDSAGIQTQACRPWKEKIGGQRQGPVKPWERRTKSQIDAKSCVLANGKPSDYPGFSFTDPHLYTRLTDPLCGRSRLGRMGTEVRQWHLNFGKIQGQWLGAIASSRPLSQGSPVV